MGNDVVMMLRLPKALKSQIDREAKRFGVSTSDLVRKKLQAVSLPSAPVVRLMEGRLPGGQLLRIEVPLSPAFKVKDFEIQPHITRYKAPRTVKVSPEKTEGAIKPDE
jgi:hypothetical protein